MGDWGIGELGLIISLTPYIPISLNEKYWMETGKTNVFPANLLTMATTHQLIGYYRLHLYNS